MERDVQVRASAREMKRLDVADNGLCFGRLDALSGDHSYIGRIGLFDEENELRTGAAGLAGTGVARVLRRHRREPGEHASAPTVPHAAGRQVVDFTDEVLGRPGGERAGGRRAARRGQRAARRGDARHRRDDPGRAGRDHPARSPGGAGDRGRPGHREDRGGAAPRRVPALHPARADGTPRRARGRAEPGVPEPHRPRAALAGRVRRGVHDHRRPRARPARHRRGRAGRRAAQGFAADPGRARRRRSPTGSGCRSTRCRSNCGTSRCGSTPRPPSGPGRRRGRAGCSTTRPARCSPRSSRTCSPNGRSPGSAGAG